MTVIMYKKNVVLQKTVLTYPVPDMDFLSDTLLPMEHKVKVKEDKVIHFSNDKLVKDLGQLHPLTAEPLQDKFSISSKYLAVSLIDKSELTAAPVYEVKKFIKRAAVD